MAAEQLFQFLCEVCCVNDVTEIDNLTKMFDISNSCLDYHMLFTHPRVVAVGLFTKMFADTFGYMPSFSFVNEIMQEQTHWDLQIISDKLIHASFLRYARTDTMLAKAFERAKHNTVANQYAFNNNHTRAKAFIWQWISRGISRLAPALVIDNETTLFSAFIKHMFPMRRPTSTATMSINNLASLSLASSHALEHLSWSDIVAVCPYQYDAISHHVTMNMNYYRSFFGRIMIHVPHTYSSAPTNTANMAVVPKVISCILGHYEKDRIVVVAPNDLIPVFKAHDLISKRQVTYIPCNKDTIIPHNIIALCFKLVSESVLLGDSQNPSPSSNSNLQQLGATLVRKIVIDPTMSAETHINTIVMCTSHEVAAKVVPILLPTPCVPLYAPNCISQSYFGLRMEIDGYENKPQSMKDAMVGRIAIYSALVPLIHRTQAPLPQTRPTQNKQNAILLIDTRPNPLSLLSILVTWANVDQTKWDIVVGTSKQHQAFYTQHLSHISNGPNVHFLEDASLEVSPFDIDAYNDLLKSPRIWQFLVDQGYKRCMIIQDDGMLVRKGVEKTDFFTDYTLVGAPWLPCPANREVNQLTDGRMVGNGGFCIRDSSDMLAIATQHADKTMMLFNACLQPIQEDLFFAKFAASTPPTIERASCFSTEQVFNNASFGFHKLWMYHPLERTMEFVRNIPI